MARRFVRIVAHPTSGDWAELPFTFDLVIEDGSPVQRRPYMGFQGKLNSKFYPCLLHADGKIDFGSDYDEDRQRYAETNILAKKVDVGSQFTVKLWNEDIYRDEEVIYSVRRIVDL